MKLLLWFLTTTVLTAAPKESGPLAPADQDLLTAVQQRAKLERVLVKAKTVSAVQSARCAVDNLTAADSSHPGSILVYTNEAATLPYFDPWGKFPEGSLVLKVKLTDPDHQPGGFTGMWKREPGYFPAGGDWEYFTVDGPASKITERGKIQTCADCHANYAKGDRITKLSAAPVQLTTARIMLHSSTATAHGEKLHYEELEKKNTLGFWVNAADWAEWKFTVTQPGTYAIHLWQGCGTGSGGAEVEILCAGQSQKFTVVDTGHFQNFQERTVGTLQFTAAGPQTLELHARTKPGGAVMDCRQIILMPLKP